MHSRMDSDWLSVFLICIIWKQTVELERLLTLLVIITLAVNGLLMCLIYTYKISNIYVISNLLIYLHYCCCAVVTITESLINKLRFHCFQISRARERYTGSRASSISARELSLRCLYRCFSKEINGKTLPVQTPTALPAYSKKTRGKNNIWWKITRGKGLKV